MTDVGAAPASVPVSDGSESGSIVGLGDVTTWLWITVLAIVTVAVCIWQAS